jgi:hypothetical protein
MAISSCIMLHVTEVASQLTVSHQARIDVTRRQTLLLDRLADAVVEEYLRAENRGGSTAKARLKLVKGLLAGEALDPGALGCEFNRHHLAVVAKGLERRRLDDLATELSPDLLLVHPGSPFVWAWLTTTHELEKDAILAAATTTLPSDCLAAFGACERGEAGWRASHMQALLALAVVLRTGVPAHYEEVALVSSALATQPAEAFLRRQYLNPIKESSRGSNELQATLRAYFAAARNCSSAAAALKVSRQTVHNRLQVVEDRLGRALSSCATNLEVALELDELDRMGSK